MGIFTRFSDIISSNINAMLDKAEDPEKLVKLMIREMEDTLVGLKASCAGIIAEQKKTERRLDEARLRQDHWEGRARLAVERQRDDLAREALVEKRRFTHQIETLARDIEERSFLVGQYQGDIRQLEEKLGKAREKQRLFIQRHLRARQARRAQEEIRRMDSYETIAKFDEFENRIERMEAEADLVNYGRQPILDAQFEQLQADDEIESELAALKTARSRTDGISAP